MLPIRHKPLSVDSGETKAPTAAFQVILLGNSGGPREDNVTGLLVRSLSTNWGPGSLLAVDGGTLLSGIIRILEQSTSAPIGGKSSSNADDDQQPKLTMTSGPFSGLELPSLIPQYNAYHIFHQLLSTVLITHPHLDHIAGLVINTPLIPLNDPKRIAALPGVIQALKSHIFNGVVWPNLANEDGGVGMITYQRLVDGGDMKVGTGEEKGYVGACEGLATKCLSLVHGSSIRHDDSEGAKEKTDNDRQGETKVNVVESSAFFVRDSASGSEIVVFGDLEPDSLSHDPRAKHIWQEAAPKVARGHLRAIFIECSYTDAVKDGLLFGHLCPRHVIAELKALAERVFDEQQAMKTNVEDDTKNPSDNASSQVGSPDGGSGLLPQVTPLSNRRDDQEQVPKPETSAVLSQMASPSSAAFQGGNDQASPKRATLHGLKVFIIHVKEEYSYAQHPRETILEELKGHSEKLGLGCEFISLSSGDSVFL